MSRVYDKGRHSSKTSTEGDAKGKQCSIQRNPTSICGYTTHGRDNTNQTNETSAKGNAPERSLTDKKGIMHGYRP